MKIKILTPNEHGKFEFSKMELEKLLWEVYDEGYKDGKAPSGYFPISFQSKDINAYYNEPLQCNTVTSHNKMNVEELQDDHS